MPRKTGKALSRQNTLSRDTLPRRDRALRDIEVPGQPGEQPLMGADQADAGEIVIHTPDISASDMSAQADNIGLPYVDTDNNTAGNNGVSGMDVAQVIREARRRKGWKQVDLARAMKVKQSAISQWESGKFLPDVENRVKLAGVLGLRIDDLLPEQSKLSEAQRLARLFDDIKKLDLSRKRALELMVRLFLENMPQEDKASR